MVCMTQGNRSQPCARVYSWWVLRRRRVEDPSIGPLPRIAIAFAHCMLLSLDCKTSGLTLEFRVYSFWRYIELINRGGGGLNLSFFNHNNSIGNRPIIRAAAPRANSKARLLAMILIELAPPSASSI